MLRLCLAALVLGYLPGALIFRVPVADRARRAQLGADERVFWHVILSTAWTLAVVLVLAAFDVYRFERLLLANSALCAALLLFVNMRLSFRRTAAAPSWTVLLPVVLIALGVWRFFPSSEYIIGGKDPGTYMSEGLQIAQRGSLVIREAVVAAVPAPVRDLFFPKSFTPEDYYSVRFMGFLLQDPQTGQTIGQFPHLFPASIAVGYGLDGLTGARMTVGVWAIAGLLAVYFAGARFVGRPTAFAGTILLGLHVIEVWFSRYPNAEVVMQALGFAALLAFSRAHQDDDRFFAPVAGLLAGLLLFARVDALVICVAMVGAAGLVWFVDRRKPRLGFVATLALSGGIAWFYLKGPMRAYFWRPAVYLQNLPIRGVLAAVVAAAAVLALMLWLRRRFPARTRTVVPLLIAVVVIETAAYAWFIRGPEGPLTNYDAFALRTFTQFYLLPAGLIATLAGFVVVIRKDFWRDPALVLTFTGFSLFFFYKILVVPVHFWMARRFLPIILPGALLFAAAAAMGPREMPWRRWRLAWAAIGVVFLSFLGQRYLAAAAPVMPHVEYAGIIPYVERLASRFSDRDLVLVESGNVEGDIHTLALPLAYIYARNVLVLSSPRPDKNMLRLFLEDARTKYDRVFFLGGGGTDLLSRHIVATPVASESAHVPEYDSPFDAYPQGPRRKDFDYGIYQITLGEFSGGNFALDVGYRDDLNVVRFFAKETESTGGRTIRWTQLASEVTIPGMTGREQEVVLVMHDGGRPKQATPARVEVFLNDVSVGSIEVKSGFQPYRLRLPAEAVRLAAATDNPARLRLVSTVWSPHDILGLPDDRQLGVMVDRVEVH